MNATHQHAPSTPLRAVSYNPSRLDAATRSYLRTIYASGGRGQNGGYCPGGSLWPIMGLVVGAGAVLAAIYLLSPYFSSHTAGSRGQGSILLAGLLAAGVMFCIMGARSILRRRGASYLGDFTFVDSQYLWQVDPVQVRVTPIHTVCEARGTHHLTNGSYNYTGITLSAPEGSFHLQLNNRAGADDVLMFVNACAHLRSSAEAGLRQTFEQCPELLGEVARRMIDDRMSDGAEFGQATPMPRPAGPAARSFCRSQCVAGHGRGGCDVDRPVRLSADWRILGR